VHDPEDRLMQIIRTAVMIVLAVIVITFLLDLASAGSHTVDPDCITLP
jgi:hypothetical protein